MHVPVFMLLTYSHWAHRLWHCFNIKYVEVVRLTFPNLKGVTNLVCHISSSF